MRWSSLFVVVGLGAYTWLACAACGKTGGSGRAEARTAAVKLERDPPTAAYGFHPVPVVPSGTPCPGAYQSRGYPMTASSPPQAPP